MRLLGACFLNLNGVSFPHSRAGNVGSELGSIKGGMDVRRNVLSLAVPLTMAMAFGVSRRPVESVRAGERPVGRFRRQARRLADLVTPPAAQRFEPDGARESLHGRRLSLGQPGQHPATGRGARG